LSRFFIAVLLAAAFACSARAAGELRPWTAGATPSLALQDLKGGQHSLEAYKGRVVLVNFWATWCEPCRAEMPSMERLRKSLDGRPFEVLAVNLAEPRSRIEKFLQQVPLGFPILLDRDRSVAKSWNVSALPTTFILDHNLKPRLFVERDYDWDRLDVGQLQKSFGE